MPAWQLFVRLGLDMALWSAMPVAFLLVYIKYFSAPSNGVLPHMYLVGLVFLMLASMRVLLELAILRREWARIVSALITSTMLATLFFYYSLVVIGLQSWGQVISWKLITTYSAQLPDLLETLNIPLSLAVTAVALIFLVIFSTNWLYLGKFDWTQNLSQISSGKARIFSIFVTSVFCFIKINEFSLNPWTKEAEPVSLTFFPLQSSSRFQSNSVDNLHAEQQDRHEDEARSSYAPNLHANRRNIILIVVDALRPDHMGLFGYARETTPNLSKRTSSNSPMILHASCGESSCGLLSMASSKFIHQFSQRPITLQEILKMHGYTTHMILSGDHTNFYDLKKIYGNVDSYHDGSLSHNYYMNDDQLVLDYLEQFPAWSGKPAMIQFHLMSSHTLRKLLPASNKYTPAINFARLENRKNQKNGDLDQRIINFYDNGVFQADMIIEKILIKLQQKDYLQNAIVVITADHGEALGEHGMFSHANSVHEELLRIPFIMSSTGSQPLKSLRRKIMGSQIDIAPTILTELNIPLPSTWSGTPLQEPMNANFYHFQQGSEVGLIDSSREKAIWKYWINMNNGKEKAFNLTLDPHEKINQIDNIAPEIRRDWRLRTLFIASTALERPILH